MPKSKLVTVVLLIMTIGLMGAIFYIGYILSTPTPSQPPIAPVRTKAADITYNKTIALNQTTVSVTPTATPAVTNTPTPTEIILAQASPTVTVTVVASSTPTLAATASATPTKTTSLPATGYINSTLIIFAAAGLVFFFSFLF